MNILNLLFQKTEQGVSMRIDCPDKSPPQSVDKSLVCNPNNSSLLHKTDSVKKISKHRNKSAEESRQDKGMKRHHRKRSANDKEIHKVQITSEFVAKTLNKSSFGKENINADMSKTTSGVGVMLSKSSTSGSKDEKQTTSLPNSACVLADHKNAGKISRRKDSSDVTQPLEKILNSSLLPLLPDNKTQLDKGR